jgi:outer membrane protein TolC
MYKQSIISFFLLLLIHTVSAQKKTLDYFINQALNNSPLLQDYQNQMLSNAIDSEKILATYKPQVAGTSYNMYAPVVKGYGYDNAVTNGAAVTALVGVNKKFVGKKNLQNQFEGINILNRGIENTAKISVQDLKRTLIAQYITTYGDLQQLNLSKEISALLSKEDTVLKKLTGSNVYRQADYLTFLVTLQQQELTVKQTAIQFQNDYATLNYLSGIVDTAAADLEAPDININALPQPENSVFFHQYTLDSLKLRNDRANLDFSYKPTFNAFADAGYNSSLAYVPYKNFGTSFGVSLNIPIYDGKQRKLQYQKLDISEKTRQHYKEFFTRQYSQQVLQLMQQLKGTQELIDQINHQIKYSEGLIQVNAKLLVTGDVRIADLVIALNNYLNAKNLLTQNTVSRLQIINQINYWNK